MLSRRRSARCARPAQRGLTLVELMIGLTLGLVVSGALLTLLANASGNGQNLQRSSRLIENARYTAELLRDDLQLAGFYGELQTNGATYTVPDPCATVPGGWAAAPLALPAPVRGYGPAEALGCLNARRAGSFALAMRRLEVFTVPAATPSATDPQDYLQVSYCREDPAAQPLAFGRGAATFTLRNRACTAANPLRAYVSRIYFVAACNRCGDGGDGVPTLKRLDLVGGALVETALVEGVEELRFEYGFDTDGDGNVDEWLTAAGATGATAAWENVMALKVHFVVRSLDRELGGAPAPAQTFVLGGAGSVTAPQDGFVRRAYSTTVRLVNPSGARELQ
jgi:type IV pilus assembly protein PilW